MLVFFLLRVKLFRGMGASEDWVVFLLTRMGQMEQMFTDAGNRNRVGSGAMANRTRQNIKVTINHVTLYLGRDLQSLSEESDKASPMLYD